MGESSKKYDVAYHEFVTQLHDTLAGIEITDAAGRIFETGAGLDLWFSIGKKIRENGLELFLTGNGASASMASHYAADLSKNAGLRATTFNDCALLTALGNDICFEKVFSESLKFYGRKDSVLLAISSSGNSPNIVAGIEQARKTGMYVITLTGMSPVNKARSLGELNIYTPAQTYGLVETAHAALLHFWTDLLVQSRGEKK